MYKFILVIGFLFSACANYPINGTMCDRIALDPHETVPQECKVYSEEEATKASTTKEEILDSDDAIEFTKEEE